jgi:hypothetical protein
VFWYDDFLYQAQSCERARRVVAKVEWNKGELFPRVGFIVTNLGRPAKRVVRFYNQRGAVRHWTLTTLREKLIGAKVVHHARQVIFQMAEVSVPRELFRAILEGIWRLRWPTLLPG